MKKFLLLALLLLTMPALAQDSVRLKMARYHNSAYNGRCVVDATYPQIPGRSDLNEKLRALIPASSKPDESEEGTVLHIEQDFKVTYNAHGLVSVFGQGLSMTSKDGHPYQAHPNKLFDALTIDLKSGKAYSLRDMFGPDAYAKLDPLISQSAAKEIGSPVELTEHTYHCYLSDKGVTFYQIFDNFAAGSVQVTIPYAQALPLANPGGPLMRLKK